MTLDVNNEASTSSPDAQNDVAIETTDISREAVEDPSPSSDVAEKDTLSIVREVVGEEGEEAVASSAEGAEEGSANSESETKKEPDNEDFTDVPFGKHPRFRELIKERNALRPDATRYRNVQKFMDDNGISSQEAADSFMILGLMKTNPAEAWNKLKPIVKDLLIQAGEVLPDDLAGRVQRGELSPEVAVEISRSRAKASSVETEQRFHIERTQKQQQTAHAQSLMSTANTWETERKARDPNYDAKQTSLKKELLYLQSQEGVPNTPQGVRDQLDRAYKAIVVPAAAAPISAPRPKTPVRATNSAGQGSGNAQPKPTSTLEIIRQARGG